MPEKGPGFDEYMAQQGGMDLGRQEKDKLYPEKYIKEKLSNTNNGLGGEGDNFQSEDDSRRNEIRPETLPAERRPTSIEKARKTLDFDIENLNKECEKKLPIKVFKWLQRNTGLRIATGIAVSAVGTALGWGVGAHLAKAVVSGLGGAMSGAGLASWKIEAATLKKYHQIGLEKLNNENDEQYKERINSLMTDSVKRNEILSVYANLTEIASARGKIIAEKLSEDEQKSNDKAKASWFEKLKEKSDGFIEKINKSKFGSLDIKKKVALGALAAFGGGIAAGAIVGATAAVLTSGAINLGFMAINKGKEDYSDKYQHSQEILKLKKILDSANLDNNDISLINEIRTSNKRKRVVAIIAGGAILGALGFASGGSQDKEPLSQNGNIQTGTEHNVNSADNFENNSNPNIVPASETTSPEAYSPEPSPKDHIDVKIEEVEHKGSDNLYDELAKITNKDEFYSEPGSSEKLAEKIVDGLRGKGQISFANEEDREQYILGISQHLKNEEIFNEDGSLNDFEALKKINPLQLKNTIENFRENGIYYHPTDTFGHHYEDSPEKIAYTAQTDDKLHQASVNLEKGQDVDYSKPDDFAKPGQNVLTHREELNQAGANLDRGHGIDYSKPEQTILTNQGELGQVIEKSVSSSGSDFERAISVDRATIDKILDPDNKYLSKEVAEAYRRELESGRISYTDVRISSDGSQIKFHLPGDALHGGPEREYIGHEFLKKVENVKSYPNLWQRIFGIKPENIQSQTDQIDSSQTGIPSTPEDQSQEIPSSSSEISNQEIPTYEPENTNASEIPVTDTANNPPTPEASNLNTAPPTPENIEGYVPPDVTAKIAEKVNKLTEADIPKDFMEKTLETNPDQPMSAVLAKYKLYEQILQEREYLQNKL